MWLPDRVYNALPWIYGSIGLLFFAGVIYRDQRDFPSGVYFTTGVVAIAGGLVVLDLRVSARTSRENAEQQSDGDTAAG